MAEDNYGLSVPPDSLSAARWCLLGGICAVYEVRRFMDSDEANKLRQYLVSKSPLVTLSDFNDDSDKETVLAWLDNLIKEVPEEWTIDDGLNAEEARNDKSRETESPAEYT